MSQQFHQPLNYFEVDNWDYKDFASDIVKSKPPTLPEQTLGAFAEGFREAFNFLGLSEYRLEVG